MAVVDEGVARGSGTPIGGGGGNAPGTSSRYPRLDGRPAARPEPKYLPPLPDTSKDPHPDRPYQVLPGVTVEQSKLRKLTPFAAPVEVTTASLSSGAEQTQSYAGYPAALDPRTGVPHPPTGYAGHPMNVTGSAGAPTEPETKEVPGKERTRRTQRLSWDEYNRLSREQRAAVDFNTLLVQARE